jgi:nucleoside-diphosphate-sugar epimerase
MRVLVIGATGFLGGAAAKRLLRDRHEVIALVRSSSNSHALKEAGIATAPGSLDDAASLKRAIADADAVINGADSDHAAGIGAILQAIAGTGKTFIHASGISVTADHAAGAGDGVIRDETTPYQPIRERAARYAIDQNIRAAAANGCRPVVMCCPLVYGAPAWPGRESVQLPTLLADARKHGAARYVGAGEARWSHCHVDDIAEAFALALAKGKPGALYYPENGEQSWGELAAKIGRVAGLPTRSITLDEGIAAWGPRALWTYCSNARTRGVRIRADLGWAPRIDDVEGELRRLAGRTS